MPRLVLIVGLLALPLLLPSMYWQRVISIICIYALLALSFDFLAHFVGLVSLGGAFFVGVGGYMAALLNTALGLSPWLTIPLAALAGGAICTLLLLPCLPLRGVYFAIVSLMYPLFVATAHRGPEYSRRHGRHYRRRQFPQPLGGTVSLSSACCCCSCSVSGGW